MQNVSGQIPTHSTVSLGGEHPRSMPTVRPAVWCMTMLLLMCRLDSADQLLSPCCLALEWDTQVQGTDHKVPDMLGALPYKMCGISMNLF